MKMMMKGGGNEAEENVFWTTMSDLLLGLAIIFIVLFVLAMTGFSQKKNEEREMRIDVATKLENRMKKEKINAYVNKTTAGVRIPSDELFATGSANLSESGKRYLRKFIPAYLDTVLGNPEISDTIDTIVIQGHTDSQRFVGVNSDDLQFILNMELSTNRANNVATYLFFTPYKKKYNKALHKKLVVEGRSSAVPILNNGKEDFDASRRVEFNIVVRSVDFQEFMQMVIDNDGKRKQNTGNN